MPKYILIGGLFFGLVILPMLIIIFKPVPLNFKSSNNLALSYRMETIEGSPKYIIEIQYPVIYSFDNPTEGLINKNIEKLANQIRDDLNNNPIMTKAKSASSSSTVQLSYDLRNTDKREVNVSFDISKLWDNLQKFDLSFFKH